MLLNVEHARRCLERCREAIAASRERAREGAKLPTGPHEEHRDAAMHENSLKLRKSVTEVKKSRNRAAPGRCHSCNRTETPEWRRGPDGVGTLCNACGLQYAKLRRKRV
ncbi:GATA zinc finger domain-containing protein [Trichoderma sp. SZMC 28013]